MRRAVLAAIGLMVALEPAEACRHFRFWHYDFPQRCNARGVWTGPVYWRQAPAPSPAIAFVPPAPPHILTPAHVSIPSLTDIDWGKTPDDEALARMKLRAVLQAKEN